jgi:antitoxin ParD1/3/4
LANASEVIRAGLRLIDEREQKIQLLREAIEAGEKSGYVKKTLIQLSIQQN